MMQDVQARSPGTVRAIAAVVANNKSDPEPSNCSTFSIFVFSFI